MKIKSIVLIIVFFISVNIFSQANLNDYKYIIVPEQYSFFKTPNKYRLNELGKFLFNKYGFTAFLTNETFPNDLKNDGCLALRTKVDKEPGLFTTKLKITLNDCKGNPVFVSRIGLTREKDLTKAYNLALRDAFKSFANINYKYIPKENEVKDEEVIVANNDVNAEEVKRLQDEVKALQAEKEKQLKELEEAKIAAEEKRVEEAQKAEALRQEKEREIALQKEAKVLQEEKERQKRALEKEAAQKVNEIIKEKEALEDVLYAQSIENGYQLVDSTPKVVMVLIETGRKDTFIVKDQNATVYKEDGVWFISKTENNKPVTEKINIKF